VTATAAAAPRTAGGFLPTEIRIARDYPHPRRKVWRALTDPRLIALWAMRPEGFSTAVGTRFRLVAKPQPGWRGFVECEVLEAREGEYLRYSWKGDEGGKVLEVSYALEDIPGGTRLTLLHTGFTGVGGFVLAKMMMGPGWKKMLAKGIAAVLENTRDDGTLVEGAKLQPRY
jgi:uncharacterized protein YndB with AHSA1/START domain